MIVLASQSPRRRELLRLIFDDFKAVSSDVDETLPQGITPYDAVMYLSRIKAQPFRKEGDIVIGADTVVALDDEILGKPTSDEDAVKMLKKLSSREHSVFTGVTIISGNDEMSFFVETRVKFLNLSDEDIERYIRTREHTDKAGAYGIQGFGSLLVEKIDGDYFNVVGLPVSRLNQELKAFISL